MIVTERLSVATKGDLDIVNITRQVEKIVSESGIRNGIVTVFVPGSTASVSTIEYEKNLLKDMERAFERIAPSGEKYEHHQTWGDDNGKSHVRATVLGPGQTFPFEGGKLILGMWQQIVLIDFDTSQRTREIVVQVMGE